MRQPDTASSSAPGVPGLTWGEGGARDVPSIARLAAAAFDPGFREAWSEAQIAGMVADPAGWLDVGRNTAVSGAPVLAFALSRAILDEVELLLFAICPGARRLGLGRTLVAQVCESSRRRGARRVFLEVRASNTPARTLYQSVGFMPSGHRPGYYRSVSGDSIDAITLALPLSA